MRKNRYQVSSKFRVLKTNKTVKGEPLNGKFYGEVWEDGETVDPMSYRDAMRIARLRGLQSIDWEDSKAYKRLMEGTPAEPVKVEEAVEVTTSIFDKLRKATGTEKPKRKRTTRKKKTS